MWTRLERWGGPAMIIGGALWILGYGMDILIGVTGGQTGYDSTSPPARFDELLWHAGFLGLGLGLLGLSALLGHRPTWLSRVAITLACMAIAVGVVNPVVRSNMLGFLGVLGSILGAVTLGIAALRTDVLTGPARLLPLAAGLVFFPMIVLSFPLESLVPSYVAGNLPFPIVAVGFVATGMAMAAAARQRADRPAIAPVLRGEPAV